MSGILFFNPRALRVKPRIPNSILQVAASIEGKYDWAFVDGNLEIDPWPKLKNYLLSGQFKYFGCTVMPGPQLKQAIPLTKKIREEFPHIRIIWGGYFATNQHRAVMNSRMVDYVINGPGDFAFPKLLDVLEQNLFDEQLISSLEKINNLIFIKENQIVKTPKDELYDQDALPVFPYEKLDTFYPMSKYLGPTYLGSKTIAYHSSVGCPFTCSFCGLVPIYNARWKAKSAQRTYNDIKYLKEKYGGNAIEFHDNNFFVSEKRVIEFAKLIKDEKMEWWGEGRIDTIDRYSDESLALIREAGCRMIFFGAETGSDEQLKKMNKGGTQTSKEIKAFAARMKKFDIIPEYSFILGLPGDSPKQVLKQVKEDMQFIRTIKEINPETEIIIYVYSPVATEGSEMFEGVLKTGFNFPDQLETWRDVEWKEFDMHRNPATPWLNRKIKQHIWNFETVLNGYFPTYTDYKLTKFQRTVIHTLATWRYKWNVLAFPYEIKVLQKFWMRYRQPETEGF
jgi:anaerobic magnesium-protoporphyrin IX monomethyl ester cyclase